MPTNNASTLLNPQATTSQSGWLSSTDWNTFNSKGSGTVTTLSVVPANGISASISNATTTPAITLALGSITPTSVNGLTLTALATGFTLAGGTSSKTLTVNNTLALSGTDSSTLNIGAGGTLGSAAYTASSAYEVPLSFSTGLTRTTNTITVNSTQNISRLSNLTSNGFIRTSAGDGTLVVDTNTYLTANQTITLSGAVSGSGATSITTTLANSVVTLANQADVASGTVFYRKTAGAGAPEVQTLATLKTDLAISTSDVSGLGTLATQNANSVTITGGTISGADLRALLNAPASPAAGSIYRVADTLRYRDSANTERLLLNATDNLSNLTNTSTARTNLGLGTLATQSGTFSGTSSGTNTGDQTITLTGDVTGSGTGSFTATIAANAVTYAKIQTQANDTLLGNNSGSTGVPSALTSAQVKTLLAIANTDISGLGTLSTLNSVDLSGAQVTGILAAARFPALTGNITTSAGSLTTTIAAGAVTLAMQANVATGTVFYRKTAGTGSPEVQTLATLKTDLAISTSDISGLGALATLSSVDLSGSQATGILAAARFPALTGAITTSAGSVTTSITDNAVTLAKIQQVATSSFLGRVSASTGNVETLTGTQATSLLDTFTASLKGLVPSSGGGTTTFLRADGSWSTTGTVTTVSVTSANGISGSVATASSTPAITLTLGAITPSSVNGLVLTALATGFSVAGGTSSKTLTISNTLTLLGTDGSSLNIGAGGTLGSAAYTASSSYEVPLTFSTGLTRTGNTITVNATQSISRLSNLSTNGFIRTSGADGTLAVDTNTYLTANQAITLSGDVSGSGSTAISTTIGANAVTLAKFQQIATASFLGRVTASTGNTEVLTGTQATTLLDLFTSSLKGLVPSSGGGTTNFLRADGTWAAPPGGGGGVSDGDKGDITVSGGGATWTIDTGAVTLSKIQTIATGRFLGNNSGSTASPSALTGTQATALLDTFSTSLQGLVPAPGGTTTYLRADGWATLTKTLTFSVGASGGAITTGGKEFTRLVSTFSGTITSWNLVSYPASTCTVDIWKSAAGVEPTNSNSITASAKPALSADIDSSSSTLTGWTTAISAGELLQLEIEANNVATYILLTLTVTL